MEFLKGRIFTDPGLPELSPSERLDLYFIFRIELMVDGKRRQRRWQNYILYHTRMWVYRNSDEREDTIRAK